MDCPIQRIQATYNQPRLNKPFRSFFKIFSPSSSLSERPPSLCSRLPFVNFFFSRLSGFGAGSLSPTSLPFNDSSILLLFGSILNKINPECVSFLSENDLKKFLTKNEMRIIYLKIFPLTSFPRGNSGFQFFTK